MSLIKIDIVIPTLDNYNGVKYLLSTFKSQKNIKVNNVIVPITISKDIERTNKIRELCKQNGATVFEIEQKDFSHSLTREKAIREYCKSDIVVLLTDDVKLVDEMAMYNLVKDIASGEVIYTYGRQICSKRCGIERYVRAYNYPSTSFVATKDDIKQKHIKTFFASDVFAGLDRNAFIKLGGYQGLNLPSNEDMIYMYFVLTNGYKAKYCADAVVEHYHSCSSAKLYKRYYDTGRFFKMVDIFNQYEKKCCAKKLAFYVLKNALKHFDIITVLRWPFNMLIRYIGMVRGERAKI